MEPQAECEVCFFRFPGSYPSETTRQIECKKCKRAAHRFCYDPNVEDSFTCDPCIQRKTGQKCCICGNDGLLKSTSNGQFAHPVCLMFSQTAFVKSYITLEFQTYQAPQIKKKQGRCHICDNPGKQLFCCFAKDCRNAAHFYCILKECYKQSYVDERRNIERFSVWKQNLKIPENRHYNYLKYYECNLKKFIKHESQAAFKLVWQDRKLTCPTPIIIVYCPDHNNQLLSCVCVTMDLGEQIDWIGCDVCERWYHFACQGLVKGQEEQGEYRCKQCAEWHEIQEKRKEPIMKVYPKLHFYDLAYIQFYCEKKNYFLTEYETQTVINMPFFPSLNYAFGRYKTEHIDPHLIKGINMVTLKKSLERFQEIKLDRNVSVDKKITEIASRLEILLTKDFLESIRKVKAGKITFRDLLNLLKKYQEIKKTGSNLVKPALQILKKFDDDSMSSNSQTVKEIVAKQQLEKQIEIIENSTKKELEKSLIGLIKTIIKNQTLKQHADYYIQKKFDNFECLQSIILYHDPSHAMEDLKLNYLYSNLRISDKIRRKQIIRKIEKLIAIASYNVKKFNMKIIKEVDVYQLASKTAPNSTDLTSREKLNEMMREEFKINEDIFKISPMFPHVFEKELTKNLNINWLVSQLRDTDFNLIQKRRVEYIVEKFPDKTAIKQLVKNYVQLFSCFQNLLQKSSFQRKIELKQNLTESLILLEINKENIDHFTEFFNKSSKTHLRNINKQVKEAIYKKFLSYVEYLEKRNPPVQKQKQYYVIKFGINNQIINNQIFECLKQKDDELIEMLICVENRELENPELIKPSLQALKNAKSFCQLNSLQFRLPKIEYAIKNLQLWQEALTLFPHHIIVQSQFQVPEIYNSEEKNEKTIDFYRLQNFLRKLAAFKFPTSTKIFQNLKYLFEETVDFYKDITDFIMNYNILLNRNPPKENINRVQKSSLEDKIAQSRKSVVKMEPEVLQVTIIFNIYQKLLNKARQLISSQRITENDAFDIHKKIMGIPLKTDPKILKPIEEILTKKYDYEKNLFGFIVKPDPTRFLTRPTSSVSNPFPRAQYPSSSYHTPTQYSTVTLQKQEGNSIHQEASQLILRQLEKKPHSLSIEEIKERLGRDLETDDVKQELKKMIEGIEQIHNRYHLIMFKFKKNQVYSSEDIREVKDMMEQYEKQRIRSEVLQNIISQYRLYKNLKKIKNEEQRNAIRQSLSPSFLGEYDLNSRKGVNRRSSWDPFYKKNRH